MFNDPIVEETRVIRDQMASEYGCDIYKLGRHFIDKQKLAQRMFVDIPGKSNNKPKLTRKKVKASKGNSQPKSIIL
jgi:hypothetical protein